MLEALERGIELETPDADVASQMSLLFDHFYPPEKRAALDAPWTLREAMQAFQTAEPFVGEGTILSDARVRHQTRSDRNTASLQLLSQKRKMRELGPTLVSAYHDLTTNAKTHAHEFYIKWVEITVMKSMAIGQNMVSQLVFTRYPFKTANKRIDSGTTPEQLVDQQYALVPLAHEDRATFDQMEATFHQFTYHRMATRTDRPLSAVQNTNLRINLARMEEFTKFIGTLPDTESGATRVHVLFPPRVLLGNDESFEDTLANLKGKVKAGTIRRFAIDPSLGYLDDKTTGVFMCSAVLYM